MAIVRRPKKHKEKDYEDERVIPKEGKEIFRWIQSRWKNIPQPNRNYEIHKRHRVKAKEGLKRWVDKTYLWVGDKEEICKEQMEDPMLEEYRARAIERNRGGI